MTSASTSAWRPQSEVELIVGTPPGGGQDRPARALIKALRSDGLIDVPMRVTNTPGKGGGNAWDSLRRRARDPHVLSISSAPLITNKALSVSDFDHAELTPIATLYTEYLGFVVRADSSLRTAATVLERLRADAGGLTVALATAVGTTNHIAIGQVAHYVGGDAKALRLHVFESALHAVADVLEGNADLGVVSAVSAAKPLDAGKLRALAVSAPGRLGGVYVDAPTWVERSVPCVIGQWRGILGAQGITRDQVAYWEQALTTATASPGWAADLEQNYWTGTYKASEDTREFLDSERAFLSGMLQELGLTG
ncbi:MAG: tripartite tricarboxylate transporter substrate binding protein [Betaproteobacteria bacterium]|nr:tripartite tricarboxylate transporter substrate binding protein [Betaproteobacteria bacterium]